MKSARSIKMDYNAMLQKAGSLEDLAERLYRIADSIDRENDRIASGWTGAVTECPGSPACCKKNV